MEVALISAEHLIAPFISEEDRARLRPTCSALSNREEAIRVRADWHSFQDYWTRRLWEEWEASQVPVGPLLLSPSSHGSS